MAWEMERYGLQDLAVWRVWYVRMLPRDADGSYDWYVRYDSSKANQPLEQNQGCALAVSRCCGLPGMIGEALSWSSKRGDGPIFTSEQQPWVSRLRRLT